MAPLTYINIAFYAFASLTLLGAFLALTARNGVHGVLFLMLTFFNGAGLLLLLGAELLAMTLIIVYVGAVAVLFLFVVMMLETPGGNQSFLYFKSFTGKGLWISLILFGEILFLVFGGTEGAKLSASFPQSPLPNAQALGHLLYTDYGILFQMAGLILLAAMVGSIMLTHRHRSGVRTQIIDEQLTRHKGNTLEIKKVPFGKGVS